MVSFCGTYWLSSDYFILLRVFRLFLFLSFLLLLFFGGGGSGEGGERMGEILLLAEVLRYVCQYLK